MRNGDTISNIETLYREIKFRSRLEARWAVFWDHFSAEWEYEPERIRARDVWYAPDFLVLNIKLVVPGLEGAPTGIDARPLVVEIKPLAERAMTESEGQKIRDYLYSSEHGLLLIQGSPWDCTCYHYRITEERALERARLQWGAWGGDKIALYLLWIECRGVIEKPWSVYPSRSEEIFKKCFTGVAADARESARYWDFGPKPARKLKKRGKK
jgi:hypothetical protein